MLDCKHKLNRHGRPQTFSRVSKVDILLSISGCWRHKCK